MNVLKKSEMFYCLVYSSTRYLLLEFNKSVEIEFPTVEAAADALKGTFSFGESKLTLAIKYVSRIEDNK